MTLVRPMLNSADPEHPETHPILAFTDLISSTLRPSSLSFVKAKMLISCHFLIYAVSGFQFFLKSVLRIFPMLSIFGVTHEITILTFFYQNQAQYKLITSNIHCQTLFQFLNTLCIFRMNPMVARMFFLPEIVNRRIKLLEDVY